jgi:hypothetical protein
MSRASPCVPLTPKEGWLSALQTPVVIITTARTDRSHQAEITESMSTSLPISCSNQPRRYRLVDHHGQHHLELDEHFELI